MTTEIQTEVGSSGVRVERNGPVATVTLCRPDVLNAQTPAMWAALRDAGRDLPGDVRVVVVRGEGRAFSAGLDLRQANEPGAGALAAIAELPPDDAAERIAGYQAGFTWLGRPDIVSVAAVQGHAIGAGFQLALACDLRILTTDAKLTMAEVSLGLVPDLGGTAPLVGSSATHGRSRSARPGAGWVPRKHSQWGWRISSYPRKTWTTRCVT